MSNDMIALTVCSKLQRIKHRINTIVIISHKNRYQQKEQSFESKTIYVVNA